MINSEDRLTKVAKIFIILILLVLCFIAYAYRLFSMQIVQGEHYRSQSQRISSQITVISAQRGEIFDRNALLPIVINTDSFAVEVTPGAIPKDRYDTVMLKLAQYLGISKSDIDKKIPKNIRRSYTTIQVKSNVPFTIISNIAENIIDLPGVSWVSKPIRNYQHTGSMSHIVGYVGDINQDEMTVLYNQGYKKTSIVGKTGIEKQYDSLLQGKEGREMSTVDVHGRIISDTPIVEPPEMGKSLVLTIDSDIQKLVEDALTSNKFNKIILSDIIEISLNELKDLLKNKTEKITKILTQIETTVTDSIKQPTEFIENMNQELKNLTQSTEKSLEEVNKNSIVIIENEIKSK